MISNPHLNILVQLAKIDGETDDTELELIRQIGKSENLSDEDIDMAIESTEAHTGIPSLSLFSDEEKLELMTNLVLVMKIDGILHKNEMKFCLDIVHKMGFSEDGFFELVKTTTNDIKSDSDINTIRDRARSLLIA